MIKDNNYNFAVTLPAAAQDPNGFYKRGIVDKLINKYPWLTVAGLDDPTYTPSGRYIRGIEYAGAGNVLTFGTAKSHDVNWVNRPDFVREKGYTPVYDIVKDWNTVVNRMDAFANARKPRPVYTNSYYTQTTGNTFYVSGQKVEVFDNFIKIGYHVIPRNANVSSFCGYTPVQLETVKQVIVTIKYLY